MTKIAIGCSSAEPFEGLSVDPPQTRIGELGQGMRTVGRVAFKVMLWGLAGILVLAGAGSVLVWRSWTVPPAGDARSAGPNAMWAAHRWVGQQHTEAEYDALADLLETTGMTDVFFHVGPLSARGTIDPGKYPNAEELARELEQRVPKVRVQAWIGQVEARGGGPLDLGNPQVRARVVETASRFLDLGFEGVHYNIEPWFSGDERLLDLLRATSQVTRSRGAVLSVATNDLQPLPGAAPVSRVLVPRGAVWTADYYSQVAALADQVAVMAYDTGMPTDWLYGAYVARQTRRLAALVPEDTTLFIGLPTYDEPGIAHRPAAENIATGVRAVRKGVTGLGPGARSRIGIAVYAGWTTDPGEWATFRRAWLGRSQAARAETMRG